MKQPYLLLTPGPLSTTASVKDAMQIDYCTWDSDYRHVSETIRQQILAMAACQSRKLYDRPTTRKRQFWC